MPIEAKLEVPPRLLEGLRGFRRVVAKRFRQYMARADRAAKLAVSGSVLRVRSGALRAGITHTVEEGGEELLGRLGTSVRYGAAHEFGAIIPAREVRPVRARVLRFTVGGETVFSRFARIPAVTLPARPFLRPALEGEVPALVRDLEQDSQRLGGA